MNGVDLISIKQFIYETIYPNIKTLIIISIMIPIMFNIIILILFKIIDIKGIKSIALLGNNKIYKKFIDFLIRVYKSKELLIYIRKRGYAEILFYVITLILVLILL